MASSERVSDARYHTWLNLAQSVARLIQAKHREKSIRRTGNSSIEIGVAIGVVNVGIAEKDIEDHCLRMLLLQVFEEFPQHLPWPRPSTIFFRHCGQACLVNINDDNVLVRLRDNDAVTHHRVESGLAHVCSDVEKGCISDDEQREYYCQIDIKITSPPGHRSMEQSG